MSNSFTFLPKNDKLDVQFWKVPDNCSETGHSSLVSRDIRFEETFAAGRWVHGILARRSSLLPSVSCKVTVLTMFAVGGSNIFDNANCCSPDGTL